VHLGPSYHPNEHMTANNVADFFQTLDIQSTVGSIVACYLLARKVLEVKEGPKVTDKQVCESFIYENLPMARELKDTANAFRLVVTKNIKAYGQFQEYGIQHDIYFTSIEKRKKYDHLKPTPVLDPVAGEGENVVQRVLGIATIEMKSPCSPGTISTGARCPLPVAASTPTTVRKPRLGGRGKPKQDRDWARIAADRLKTIKKLESRLENVKTDEQFFRWVNEWARVDLVREWNQTQSEQAIPHGLNNRARSSASDREDLERECNRMLEGLRSISKHEQQAAELQAHTATDC
jgi:hypothetical protein